MEQFVFYLFAVLIVVSAILVVSMRNIFHCALYLIICLFLVAGIYVLLHAEFLAVVQVLIYVGAVAILMIFAIMLTSKLAGREALMSNEQTGIGFFLTAVLALGLILSFKNTFFRVVDSVPESGSTMRIGQLLMTDYVLPFELVSVVLLSALIGAILISRREGN